MDQIASLAPFEWHASPVARLAWADQSWTGIRHGNAYGVLPAQAHPMQGDKATHVSSRTACYTR